MFAFVIAAGLATGQVYTMESAPPRAQAAQDGPPIRYTMESPSMVSGPLGGDRGLRIEVGPDDPPFHWERTPSARAEKTSFELERWSDRPFPRWMSPEDREILARVRLEHDEDRDRDRLARGADLARSKAGVKRASTRTRGDYIMEDLDPPVPTPTPTPVPVPYDPGPIEFIPPSPPPSPPAVTVVYPAPALVPTFLSPASACVGGQCGPVLSGFNYGAPRRGGFLGRVFGR